LKNPDFEPNLLREFAEFVEAAPRAPSQATEQAVLQRVEAELRPPRWKIYTRLGLLQTVCGLLTLTLCPQFGLGFGTHQFLLHSSHAALPPAVFYLVCGLFFVSLGALLSGLRLRRAELRALGGMPWGFFFGYGSLAYGVLLTLGEAAFMAASLSWVAGAVLGNALGFAVTTRLRQHLA
jgi:hypothetical protein